MPHTGDVPSLPTLRDWLATLDEAELENLRAAHPALQRGPAAHDLDHLAAGLAHPTVVGGALLQLPAPALYVIEATAALGLGATVSRLCTLLNQPGVDGAQHAAEVQHWLDAVRSWGLVWPDGDRLRVNPGVRRIIPAPLGLGAAPAEELLEQVTADTLRGMARGLGIGTAGPKDQLLERVAEVLADPVAIRQRVAAAPGEVLAALTATVERALAGARFASAADRTVDDEAGVADGAERTATYRQMHAMHQWLVSAGLAVSPWSWAYYAAPHVPTEIYLALAPPDFTLPFPPRPPAVTMRSAPEEQVGRSAAAAAAEFLSTAMAVLEGIARAPLVPLKTGGIGAREVGRHAKAVGVAPASVRLVLSIAAGAGLLEMTSGGLSVADGFDAWRRRPPAERAADLVHAWLGGGIPPTLDRDTDGRTVPILGPDPRRVTMPVGWVLCALAADWPGRAVVDIDEFLRAVAWHHPLGEAPPGAGARAWAEAHQLGLVADDAITALGRAAVTGARAPVIDALAVMLPEVSSHALIGSDQTILVPGSPDPAVVDLLDIVATRETRGTANTWRITPASVRGALDDGYAVEDLVAALEAVSQKELPQAMVYLLRDVARKHGHLRVQSAACVIRSDDKPLLAEVVAMRKLHTLGLSLVAPTVAIAARPAEAVLTALRSAGYLPVMADGEAPVLTLKPLPGRRPSGPETSRRSTPR